MLDKDCGYEDRPSGRNSPKEIFRVPLGFIIHQITKKVVEKNKTHKVGITVAPAGHANNLEVLYVVTKKGVSCLYDITCKENDSELQ